MGLWEAPGSRGLPCSKNCGLPLEINAFGNVIPNLI